MAASVKVAVLGALDGNFDIFQKLAKIHAKNSFAFALICGDLCAKEENATPEQLQATDKLISGHIDIPLTTYCIRGASLPQNVEDKANQNEGEICPNLILLAGNSSLKTSSGIRVVSVEDLSNLAKSQDDSRITITSPEAEWAKILKIKHADILLTHGWPASIRSFSKVQDLSASTDPGGSTFIANACEVLKPRYHFAGQGDHFFEREPFRHHATKLDEKNHITRFINLACCKNQLKQKWLYAFTFTHENFGVEVEPVSTTASPFPAPTGQSGKRSIDDKSTGAFVRFKTSTANTYPSQERHRRKRARLPLPTPETCFFCLSNPNIAAHLILSIGEEAYLTTAKGPLTTAKTFEALDFPAHLIIIPLSHCPTLHSISPLDSQEATRRELHRYRSAVHAMVATKSDGHLGVVTWEVSKMEGIHVHWQLLPVSKALIQEGLVEAAFKVEAENDGYEIPAKSAHIDGTGEDHDCLRFWLWTPAEDQGNDPQQQKYSAGLGQDTCFEMPLPRDRRFDVQFARVVMAKLLGLEDRMQWRDCGQDVEDESAEAESFKAAFKPYDFTIDED